MRPFLKPAVKTQPFIATALVCIMALFAQPPGRAAELVWSNTDSSDPNTWATGSAANWWDGANHTVFTASSAVVFGSPEQPDARSGRIIISSSSGVTIAASGTNPGMIVTGGDDWEFVLSYTTASSGTATRSSGIGITGTGAGVLKEGAGTLTFSMTTGYTGTTEVRAGTLRLNVADAIAKSSNVVLSSTATLDLAGYDQTLKALNVAPGANIKFNSDAANFRKLTLGALTATDAATGAVFDLRADLGAGQSDRIILTGTSEGAHTLRFSQYEGDTPEKADTSILVVENKGGGNATFSGAIETQAHAYAVEQGANGSWYLNNTELPTRIASAVIASAAAAGQDWHYELDALYKRMGELREPPGAGTASVWLRANAARTNASRALTGYEFHQYTYGVTLGADKAFGSGDSTWFAGAFGAINRVKRDFDQGGEGRTDSTGAGLYVTWMHETGWFADLIGRMDRNKNNIDAITADGYLAAADFDTKIKGLSLEFGRRLYWNEEWWIEPAVQYAVADIGGADYHAEYVFGERASVPVSVQKSRASQARFSFRLGEAGGSNPGWHPYAKAGIVHSSTSDGRVRVGAGENLREFSADFDGWRWEVGFGAAYVIGPRSQFYYDYEYAHATHYNRPWSVNLGYRFVW